MPQDPDPGTNFTSEQSDELVAQAPSRSPGQVVEDFLDTVGTEAKPAPLLNVEGLRGRVAIVTGASRGIGRAIAVELAASGVNIAFNFLDSGAESRREAHETQAELNAMEVRVLCRACDVRDPDGVRGFVEESVQEMGGHVIRLLRAPFPDDKHESETALDFAEMATLFPKSHYYKNTTPILFDAVLDNCKMTIAEQNEAVWDLIKERNWL